MADIFTAPVQTLSNTPGAGDWKIPVKITGLNTNESFINIEVLIDGATEGGSLRTCFKADGLSDVRYPVSVPGLLADQAVVVMVQSLNPADNVADPGGATVSASIQRASVNALAINSSTLAAEVLAAEKYSYRSDAVVLVADGTDDAERGVNLAAAYATVKALTPGGNDRSATNRVTMLTPPGRYSLAAQLDLDANFIDWLCLVSATGTAVAKTLHPTVEVYLDNSHSETRAVRQTVTDIRLRGLRIESKSLSAPWPGYGSFFVDTEEDCTASTYDDCVFVGRISGGPVMATEHATDVCGAWRNCMAIGEGGLAYGWRCGEGGVFRAEMHVCLGEDFCYGGDADLASFGECLLDRCVGRDACFAGCGAFGIPISPDAVFWKCVGRDRCFGLGVKNEGVHIECRGRRNCFGGTTDTGSSGEFAGLADRCLAEAGGFGGRAAGIGEYGKLTGTLRSCICIGNELPWRAEGAAIDDCLLAVGESDQDCITLLDSSSRINNSTLLVVEGGTGVPINAESAVNVSAIGNRYNNKQAATTGLGANVTNIGSGDAVADAASAAVLAAAANGTLQEGGELHNALDQVAADVAGLNGEAMRGTENALLSASFIAPPSVADIHDASQFAGVFSAAVLVNAPQDSYVVSPVSISVSPGEASAHAPLVAYQHATINFTLTIRDSKTGTARNLSGKSLRLQFFSKNDPETELFAITTDSEAGNRLVIGGDSNNVVTVEGPGTIAADARQMDWRLFNTTDMRVEGESIITIKPGPPIT